MSTFLAKNGDQKQGTRSARAAAVISASKALAQQRLQVGLVGAVSPTPLLFIDNILADDNVVSAIAMLPKPFTMLDLGSGDGRWLFAFARLVPRSLCYGVELDDQQLAKCRDNIAYCDGENPIVELLKSDFMHFPCRGFGVIVLYMSRLGNELLQGKLEKECDAGTLLIVVGFEMKGWSPVRTFRCPSSHLVAYLYVIGTSGRSP